MLWNPLTALRLASSLNTKEMIVFLMLRNALTCLRLASRLNKKSYSTMNLKSCEVVDVIKKLFITFFLTNRAHMTYQLRETD